LGTKDEDLFFYHIGTSTRYVYAALGKQSVNSGGGSIIVSSTAAASLSAAAAAAAASCPM
jgi:hypothetical protein